MWHIKRVVSDFGVREFLESLPTEVALKAKVTFDRDNTNEYCSTWYTIFYYAEREY